MQTYEKLHACRLTPEHHARTCNYWYTVTDASYAHVAFETRAGLNRWLHERGLRLENDLPDDKPGSSPIMGTYRKHCHMDKAVFDGLPADLVTVDLSNGDWTMAKVTVDGTGVRTVHTLNPNVRDRPKYNYAVCREVMR